LVERYTYSDYGTLGIYAANGTVRTSSTYANRSTYNGREWDAELKLYHFRARWYRIEKQYCIGGFVVDESVSELWRRHPDMDADLDSCVQKCTRNSDGSGLFTAQLSLAPAKLGHSVVQRLDLKWAGFQEPLLARQWVGSLAIAFLGFVLRSDADESVNRRTANDCRNAKSFVGHD
jgi:hypothetical protein